MTWIKFCGTTNLTDALAGVEAGANALGFIFAPSARRVDPKLAAEIVAALPAQLEKIGVFVNEAPLRVAEIAQVVGLTGVQLQGDEPAEQLLDFRRAVGRRRMVKTLQVRELLSAGYGEHQLEEHLAQAEALDGILLDSGSHSERGGTGKAFNWQSAAPIAQRISAELPLIVAGGLTPENVADAISIFRPWGVDVVSGVEREPGIKDHAKLPEFVKRARTRAAEN